MTSNIPKMGQLTTPPPCGGGAPWYPPPGGPPTGAAGAAAGGAWKELLAKHGSWSKKRGRTKPPSYGCWIMITIYHNEQKTSKNTWRKKPDLIHWDWVLKPILIVQVLAIPVCIGICWSSTVQIFWANMPLDVLISFRKALRRGHTSAGRFLYR